LGAGIFFGIGLIALKLYKNYRNKQLGRPNDYESALYKSVDSHKEKD